VPVVDWVAASLDALLITPQPLSEAIAIIAATAAAVTLAVVRFIISSF